MKPTKIGIIAGLAAAFSLCGWNSFGQQMPVIVFSNKVVTFTNLQGQLFLDATLVRAIDDQVIFKTNGSYGNVKFTNLSDTVLDELGVLSHMIDVQQLRQAQQDEQQRQRVLASQRAQTEAQVAQSKAEADLAQRAKADADSKAFARRINAVSNIQEQLIDAMPVKPFMMSQNERSARDAIFKSFTDISAATTLGVAKVDYHDLLTKALSTVTFQKIRLTSERHARYLRCAEKIIGFYAKADSLWDDYLKYDFMSEKEIVWVSPEELTDLRENGVELDASSYALENGHFLVPFKNAMRLYWGAAQAYTDKMGQDAAE